MRLRDIGTTAHAPPFLSGIVSGKIAMKINEKFYCFLCVGARTMNPLPLQLNVVLR
jgi:hypothetical protein